PAIPLEQKAFFTLDADDWLEHRFVEYCQGYLEQSDAAAVGCDYDIVWEGGRVLAKANREPIEAIVRINPLPCSSIIRLAAYQAVGGSTPESRFEDWILWLKFYFAGLTLFRFPRPLFSYYRHQTNITNAYTHADEYRRVMEFINARS